MDGAHTIETEVNLLDVCRMTEEEICSYTSELRTVFGFRKYAEDKDKLKAFIDNNEEYFSNVSETALNALDELTHSPELKEMRTLKNQKEGGVNMCKGLQGIIDDNRREGREEGRQEGILEAFFSLVKDGILTIADASRRADMDEQEFEKRYRSFLEKNMVTLESK